MSAAEHASIASAPASGAADTKHALGLMTGALALASDRLSGAMIFALAGSLFALGHDGLAVLVGLMGGVALSGLLVAPQMQRVDALGPISLCRARYGRIAAALAAVVLWLATVPLVAAEISAVAKAVEFASGWHGPESLAAILLAVVTLSLLLGAGAITMMQALLLPVIVAALALPLYLATLGSTAIADLLPQLAYGPALQAISAQELVLLESELADPVTMKAYLRPFLTSSMPQTLMTILALSLGVAALPALAVRTTAARDNGDARLIVAFAATLIIVALLALPPLAAEARLALLTTVVGLDVNQLPAALFEADKRALFTICGAAPVSQDAVTAACAGLDDPPTRLRLSDIAIATDGALFLMLALKQLPFAPRIAVAAVAALSGIAAALWMLKAAVRDLTGQVADTRRATSPLATIAAHGAIVLVVAAAGALVSLETADILTLLSWGLSLVAGGLAPAVLLGLWWGRATAAGAVAGLIVGAGLTLYYIIASTLFPVAFYEQWSVLSSAGYGAVLDFEAARDAWQAAEAADKATLHAALTEAAHSVANWWGIRPTAAGALGFAAGLVVTALVSLITPRPRGRAQQTIALLRRPPAPL